MYFANLYNLIFLRAVISFCVFGLTGFTDVFGQNQPGMSNIEQVSDSINLIGENTIKKGEIFLKSGDKVAFKKLTLVNDSLHFYGDKGNEKIALNHVISVTRKKSSVSVGAIWGGTLGFLGGAIAGIVANSDDPANELIAFFSNKESEFRTEDLPYIGIGMAGGAALGALLGLATQKGKVVYHNTSAEVFPSFGFNCDKQAQYLLTVRISFGSD